MGDPKIAGRGRRGKLKAGGSGTTQEALLAALRRLLAGGGEMPLWGRGALAGLFPSKTVSAQKAIDQLRAAGWVTISEPVSDKSACTVTASGRAYLFELENPRLLLEDLLRATESEADTLLELRAACARQLELLERRTANIRSTLERLDGCCPTVAAAIEHALEAHLRCASPGATSLADLFHSLTAEIGTVTIGQFHDCLRSLHRAGRIRLAPWTGPLYQLQEPQFGLLIGHEVLYYVDLARANVA
jgi:DNA-binding MarR family transcriptional regulator